MITTNDVHEFLEKTAREVYYNPDKKPPEPKEPPAHGGKGRRGPSGGCWKVNPQTQEPEYENPCRK